jgi:hypothetical protein
MKQFCVHEKNNELPNYSSHSIIRNSDGTENSIYRCFRFTECSKNRRKKYIIRII